MILASQLFTNAETAIVYAISSAIGALLIWIGKSIATLAKNQSAIHDQVMGVPEIGYPSMRDQFSEIREHLCKQDKTLEKLEHEVQDNSGSSLKDAVKIVNKDVNSFRNEFLPLVHNNNKALNDLDKKIIDINNRLEKHLTSIDFKNN